MSDEAKKQEKRVEVEIDDGPPCPDCGAIGAHYCVGKRGKSSGTIYVGVRKKAA